jgi:hypothetical protein
MTDYKIGDPVVDLAQGRPMIVLEAPDMTVAQWSESNNYELAENYANGKLGTTDDEGVVRCVYVSDIRSEPSKDYTFSESRVALIDAHHADDGRRMYDRVAVDVLEQLLGEFVGTDIESDITTAATELFGVEIVDVAKELADVEQTIGGDDD